MEENEKRDDLLEDNLLLAYNIENVSWLKKIDGKIIEILYRTELKLPPFVLAKNLGYHNEYVANRCRKLLTRKILVKEDDDFVFYSLTEFGKKIREGEVDDEQLRSL